MSTVTSSYPHPQARSAASHPSYSIATSSFPNPQQLNMEAHNTNIQPSTADYSYMQPSTPPRTPKKSVHGQPSTAAAVAESATKPRTKGKSRSKNAGKSPAVSGSERKQSTPKVQRVSSTKPISTPSAPAVPAFAGPTFHASPAPSALPLPSFFSKSFPDSPGLKNVKPFKDESTSSGSDSSTPPSTKVAVAQPNREESPLDLFFRADREEKARARSASSTNTSAAGPFQPPAEAQTKFSTPTGNSSRHRPAQHASGPSGGLFAMELDGDSSPGKPYGPAFSTPYNERIKAARSTASPQQAFQAPHGAQQSKSDALKAYLFSQQPSQARSNDSVDAPKGFGSLPPQANAGFHNSTVSGNGPLTSALPPRGHQNHNAYLCNSGAVHNSPLGARSSGLCREIEITPTKSNTESPQGSGPYHADAGGTPSRAAIDNSPSVSRDFNNLFSSNGSSHAFATKSGKPSESKDIKGMEDSLRRLLKLNPSGTSGAPIGGISRLPAAAQSAPSHIGSKAAAPMNGLQPAL